MDVNGLTLDLWLRLLLAAFGVGTGSLLFLVVINRVLGLLRDRLSKTLLMLGLLVLLAGGLGLAALLLGWPWGGALVLAVLLALLLGELRLQLHNRSRRASAPTQVHTPGLAPPNVWQRLARPVTTTDLLIYHYQVSIAAPAWPAGAKLRIAHLSDFHLNPRLPLAHYQAAIAGANAFEPDVVFLTGDYVTDMEYAAGLPDLLGALRSRAGVFAILGNHDHWADEGGVQAYLRQVGVQLLGNGWQRVQVDDKPLLLAGCEAPWNTRQRQTPPPGRDAPLLVLSHTADHVGYYSHLSAAAMFTGHYHGGQFNLPVFGPLIVPSNYGRRYARGHFMVAQTHLFVSAGVGCAKPPVRLYCPPDIILVEMTAQL